jgi:hypothetical protein
VLDGLKILQDKIQAQRHRAATVERSPEIVQRDQQRKSFLGKLLGK